MPELLDDFERVTSSHPCPVCGRKKYCLVEKAGNRVICTKDDSGRPWGEIGFMHVEAPAKPRKKRSRDRKLSSEYDTRDEAREAALRQIKPHFPGAKVTRIFQYRTKDGDLCLEKLRIDLGEDEVDEDTGKPAKQFRPVARQGDCWVVGDPRDQGLLPLFALPQLVEQPTRNVFVVEGEKTAAALLEVGLLATTWHNPAKPDKTDWSPLAGRRVILLPDKDESGEKAMKGVLKCLASVAVREVRQCQLPGLPAKGDAVDYIEAYEPRREEYTVADDIGAQGAMAPVADPHEHVDRLNVRSAADIMPRPVEWLWQDRIPKGKLTVLAGMPGVNKSFLTCDLAARISTGRELPDGSPTEAGSILMLNAEDSADDTIVPRLMAHGANLSRVHIVDGVRTGDGKDRTLSLKHDLEMLERELSRHPDCRLIVIDPINAYLTDVKDSYRDTDMRAVLNPLGKLAEKLGIAVVAVTHFSKGNSNASKDPQQRVLGSIAYVGAARSVQCVIRDPEDEDRRLLLPLKSNVGRDRGIGLAYLLRHDTDSLVPHIEWEPDPIDLEASQVFEASSDGEKKSETKRAEETVIQLLSDGPLWAKRAWELMTEAGFTKRTVDRAVGKSDQIVRECIGLGKGQKWLWRLAEHAGRIPDDA